MKPLLFLTLAACSLRADDTESDLNVNARYTVDAVHVAYVKHPKKMPELSMPLRAEIDQVVGEKLDNGKLESLASRIKKELRVPDVKFTVAKGTTPDHVTVNFEVNEHEEKFDLDATKFLYHSRQGWTGEGKATVNINGNAFSFSLLSDNDLLAERFAGIRAGFERKNMGTDRLQLRFTFASFHDQWNGATRLIAAPSELYRSRQSFTPEATVVLAAPLELSFGVDFTRVHPDGALTLPRAGTESSNAVVSTLRYHRRWGSSRDPEEQDLRASFSTKAARPWLESDFAFARQSIDAGYKYRHGRSRVDLRFLAGHLSGSAPIYERFVLGTSRTLRGWNKFDLNPMGASNAVHGTLEYSYAGCLIFYDTGAAWDRTADREQKQSLGFGFRTKDGFQLAVAFPIRAGSVDPVFYAGIGF